MLLSVVVMFILKPFIDILRKKSSQLICMSETISANVFHNIPISASFEGILSYDSSVFKRSRSGSCTLNFDNVLVAEQ